MRSNVTVGPPVNLLAYGVDELEITRRGRFAAGDPDLIKIGMRWEQALRQAVGRLPQIRFRASRRSLEPSQLPPEETIELVEPGAGEPAGAELQPQAKFPSS
jgi:predicted proteasome-type protease